MRNKPNLSPEVLANLAALDAMSDEDIDLSDMPEVTDFRGFGHMDRSRPSSAVRPVWIERELIDWFVAHGDESEPVARRVNRALQEYIAQSKRKAA